MAIFKLKHRFNRILVTITAICFFFFPLDQHYSKINWEEQKTKNNKRILKRREKGTSRSSVKCSNLLNIDRCLKLYGNDTKKGK